MASSLDMSLDDLIKKNKKPNPPSSNSPHGGLSGRRSGGGGGAAGTGPGPTRRFSDRSMNRINPYAPFDKAPDLVWQHDLYLNQFGTGVATRVAGSSSNTTTNSSVEVSTKIHVSNLDFGVLNEDIKELFGEVGELKSYSINYDRSGRSKGTAEVVFAKMADAIAAVKRYNGVQLDGKAMKIEIINTNENDINTPLIPALNINNRLNTPNNNNINNINNIQGHFPILPTPLIGTNNNNNYNNNNNNNNNNNIQSALLASPIIRANNTMHIPLLPNTFPFHGGFQTFNSHAASRRNDRDRAGKGTGGRNDRDRENRVKKKANVTASDLDAELDKYMQSKSK